MVTDSVPKALTPMANPKDFPKKKRGNRSAKMKQCKLDARREQWLSQVKNKGAKEEPNSGGVAPAPGMHAAKARGQLIEKLEIKPTGEGDSEGCTDNFSDFDSPSISPSSHTSSVLERNDSRTTFIGRSSSSSFGCCSGSMSEEDNEGDDGCFDDWEAVADALAATDKKREQQRNSSLDSATENDDNVVHMSSRPHVSDRQVSGMMDVSKQKLQDRGIALRSSVSCQAWRPDDAFRPQSLPNLSKQYTFPMNSGRHCRGGSVWGCKSLSIPSSCPICYEDLDFTDTSFLPCSCGFSLCLFCHKRILEEDGRCPGCRKQYKQDRVEGETTLDGSLMFRPARSCSMSPRF